MTEDDFGTWLRTRTCGHFTLDPSHPEGLRECGEHADHSQRGGYRCNKHLDPRERAFATND